MGEEEKKPEESKMDEKKPEELKKTEEEKKEGKEEAKQAEKPAEEKKPGESKGAKDGEESKGEAAAAAPPPPPPEIVLKVFMHCEGCARKVRKSLKGFPGVEDVITDCKSHMVVVKGEKADPLKVLERVQRKSHRRVELLSPIPKPPAEEDKEPQEEPEKPKPEEKKEEPQIITVVLKVHMHCDACAQEIKRRIQRMKGVESAEPDLKNSQVSVKGVFDPAKLVEHVYKRTGKQAVIVKQEPENKEKAEEVKEAKEEEEKKKAEEGDKEKKESEGEENKEKKEAEGEAKPAEEAATEESTLVEVKKNEYSYYPPRYGMEFYAYPAPAYAPQIFSDENPNACSVM